MRSQRHRTDNREQPMQGRRREMLRRKYRHTSLTGMGGTDGSWPKAPEPGGDVERRAATCLQRTVSAYAGSSQYATPGRGDLRRIDASGVDLEYLAHTALHTRHTAHIAPSHTPTPEPFGGFQPAIVVEELHGLNRLKMEWAEWGMG